MKKLALVLGVFMSIAFLAGFSSGQVRSEPPSNPWTTWATSTTDRNNTEFEITESGDMIISSTAYVAVEFRKTITTKPNTVYRIEADVWTDASTQTGNSVMIGMHDGNNVRRYRYDTTRLGTWQRLSLTVRIPANHGGDSIVRLRFGGTDSNIGRANGTVIFRNVRIVEETITHTDTHWNKLFLIFRHFDYNGIQISLTDWEVDNAIRIARVAEQTINQIARGQTIFTFTIRIINRPITELAPIAVFDNGVQVTTATHAPSQHILDSTRGIVDVQRYDFVHYFTRIESASSPINIPPANNSGLFFQSVTGQPFSNITPPFNPTAWWASYEVVFIHEWLHWMERVSTAQGMGNADGMRPRLHDRSIYHAAHGGFPNTRVGRTAWYEAFMNAEIPRLDGNPSPYGLRPEAFVLHRSNSHIYLFGDPDPSPHNNEFWILALVFSLTVGGFITFYLIVTRLDKQRANHISSQVRR